MQSLGRIGKSTLSQALLSWADFAGVPTAAIDADEEHKTLTGWYGERTQFLPFRGRDDLLPMIDEAGQAPVELVDFPAQATEAILQAFQDFAVMDTLDNRGIRLTIAIFASNERAGLLSAHKIISQLADRVDYVIVYNPARFKSDTFDKSVIPTLIPNAPRIQLGAITSYTIQNVDAATKKQRKSLTFLEALEHVSDGSRNELQAWLNQVYVQMEDAADVLLPSTALMQRKVVRAQRKAPAEISPFDL